MVPIVLFFVVINGIHGLLDNVNAGNTSLEQVVGELRQKVAVLEQEVTKLKQTTNVAFLAEITGPYLTPKTGEHLIYNTVHLNTGNGYHQFHGVFIAPVSGTYFINVAATVQEATTKSTHINIKKNGTVVGYIFFDLLSAQWLKNRESIIIHLDQSDEVWTEVTQATGEQIATGSMHTYFSGFLISKD